MKKMCLILCSLFIVLTCFSINAQTPWQCEVNTEYNSSGYKIQTTDYRVIYNNNKGFIVNGSLLRVYKVTDSLTAIRLMYLINTNEFENASRGLLRLSNSFSEGSKVVFTFQNTEGGLTNVSLTASKIHETSYSDEFVQHTCDFNIPNEELKTFTRRKLKELAIPFYTETFYVDVAYPTTFTDFYRCFIQN